MKVALHRSHSEGGGAPGERAYINDFLLPKLVAALTARNIPVTLIPGGDQAHPEYASDYAAFVALHYDADIYISPPNGKPPHEGGWFWDRARTSLSAAEDDRLGALFQQHYSALPGVPPLRPGRRNANTNNYYAFRRTSARTPGVILELGVGAPVCNGHGQPTAPDHDWLRANVDAIARATADALAAFMGQPAPTPTPPEPPPPAPAPVPQQDTPPDYAGQSSAHLTARLGEVVVVAGLWRYVDGKIHPTQGKFISHSPGAFYHEIYPRAEDLTTVHSDARPAKFLIIVA